MASFITTKASPCGRRIQVSYSLETSKTYKLLLLTSVANTQTLKVNPTADDNMYLRNRAQKKIFMLKYSYYIFSQFLLQGAC